MEPEIVHFIRPSGNFHAGGGFGRTDGLTAVDLLQVGGFNAEGVGQLLGARGEGAIARVTHRQGLDVVYVHSDVRLVFFYSRVVLERGQYC